MANTAVAKGNTSAENDRSSSNFDMDPYADESILEIGKTVPITHADLASLEDVSWDLRKDPEARAAFLATFTADEEKDIMNKVDRRFFVLIGIMFMVKNIDFGNISIIKTMQAGLDSNIISELNMTPDDYNWVATIQGIPYIIFELPSNLLLKYMTPHAWESRIFLTWGIVTACCGAVNTKSQILALRFLVGMFEAGMFPGVITTLSYWYRTDEVGRPLLWYFAISNLSNIVGSLVCYGASFMNGMQNLSGWRWAFILEGVATVLFAGVIFWVLPDFPKSPRSNSWLTPREQQFLEARLPSSAPATADKSWDTREAWIAFKAPTTWAFLLDQTLMNLATYALSWYLPTIIASLGFAKLPNSLLLNIPPAAAGILAMLICLGAAIGPQFFQSKWAYNRYRNTFFIGFAITLAALATNLWTWWLTRRIEQRVVEVRKDTLRARREGRAYDGRIDIYIMDSKKIKNHEWI
ncbi:hypothetical protein K4K60_001682 [Colletotrichum sp. SAR11_57]|nr:hypothetical protein K4K60_001682 [Colletotrichum sp. SAR11_57]